MMMVLFKQSNYNAKNKGHLLFYKTGHIAGCKCMITSLLQTVSSLELDPFVHG